MNSVMRTILSKTFEDDSDAHHQPQELQQSHQHLTFHVIRANTDDDEEGDNDDEIIRSSSDDDKLLTRHLLGCNKCETNKLQNVNDDSTDAEIDTTGLTKSCLSAMLTAEVDTNTEEPVVDAFVGQHDESRDATSNDAENHELIEAGTRNEASLESTQFSCQSTLASGLDTSNQLSHGMSFSTDSFDAFCKVLNHCDWNTIHEMLLNEPYLARLTSIKMTCQGETFTVASPLHMVLALCRTHKKSAKNTIAGSSSSNELPIDLIEMLVTLNYKSVKQYDTARRMRLPLHYAVKQASATIVNYLMQVYPQGLLVQDADGNTPLHLAVQYAQDVKMIKQLLQTTQSLKVDQQHGQATDTIASAAAQIINNKGQSALYLLCARGWDSPVTSCTNLLQDLIALYPVAAQTPCIVQVQQPPRRRRQHHSQKSSQALSSSTRLPLHAACDQRYPCWNTVHALVQTYPAALLQRDGSGRTPYQLAHRWHQHYNNGNKSVLSSSDINNNNSSNTDTDSHVVLAYLYEVTCRERRQSTLQKVDRFFTIQAPTPWYLNQPQSEQQKQQQTTKSKRCSESTVPTVTESLMNYYG